MLPLTDNYQRILAAVFDDLRVREAELFPELTSLPPEMELQARWFAGDFGRVFTGTSGEKIEIVQLGDWNRSAGPDFANVVVKVNGEPRSGDLELDTCDRDWENHGHAVNPAYRNVVLHVYVTSSGSGRYFTRDCDHREVPQIHIDPAAIDPRRWGRAEAIAKIGRCATPLREMTAADVESLLEAAAQYRLKRKFDRFSRIAHSHGREEALYQLTAEALGYRHNRIPMVILAQRLPLKQLREEKEAREGLLFGVAGFLDTPTYEDASPAARPYLQGLWEQWWKRREEFDGLRPLPWTMAGARPANHPHRRTGVLGALVSEFRKYARLSFAEKFDAGAVDAFLESLEHPYWSGHYTLKSKPTPRPMKLIGKTRVAEILGNIHYPVAVAADTARWDDYKSLRAELGNEKIERALIRLFGKREDAVKLVRRVYQQQGLLQVYDDFCLADESDCEDCPFPEQLAKWRSLS